jgi:hypothetical protein
VRWVCRDHGRFSVDLLRGLRDHGAGGGVHRADTRALEDARLARLEVSIAFTTILTRYSAIQLAVPASELRWGHGDGLVLRGLIQLPVTLRP